MRRKQIWIAAAGIVAVVLIGAGVILWQGNNSEAKAEPGEKSKMADTMENSVINTAMYIPYDEESYVMIDQENGTVFTVSMPEEIYGEDGSKITQEDLEKGNILTLYGNGIMLESYPGQYPGVTKIEVASKGTPSDADQYQNIIDELPKAPDIFERPYLDVEYRTELAVVTAAATTGEYHWDSAAEDGQGEQQRTDVAHILEWTDIVDLNLDGPTDLTLHFSQKPEKVEIQCWSEESKEEKDAVTFEETEDGYQMKAEPGYRYLVEGTWENGTVAYGFLTK